MNKKEFIKELEILNIKITDNQLKQLDQYYQILKAENQKYNLTRIISEEEVYLKHYYDSASLLKILNFSNQKICDIGSGAGFPGIVLKILFSDLDIVLIESSQKKCKFLNLIISSLSLKKIVVENVRVEEYGRKNRELFDIVVARAVAPLSHLLEYSAPLLKVNGYFTAMKANAKNEKIQSQSILLKLNMIEKKIIEFKLPNELSTRTLILYQKYEKTPFKYPRKYSEIIKKEI